ncbi:MAG: regulator [Saprospiraceae bacterium]|nr:regulator [Saprospiraceae bacterium]
MSLKLGIFAEVCLRRINTTYDKIRFSSSNLYFNFSRLFIKFSCKGQLNSNTSEKKLYTSSQSPEIIGTPPTLVAKPTPTNDPSLVSQYIRSIFQDSKGNYWFGPAGQSVARYDIKTLKYFSKAEFFEDDQSLVKVEFISVHAIAEDKIGNIWFGTDYGAIKYDGKTFRNYTEKNGLSNTNIGRGSILVDKAGTIWIGTGKGVFRYNPAADRIGSKCFFPFTLLPLINVKDIMEDSNGNIWFASQDHGVFRYDGRITGEQKNAIVNFNDIEGLGDNYAGGLLEDNFGNIWFTMKGGICRYDGKQFTNFTTNDGLGGSEVWGIFMEKSGNIWISARGSTTRFDPSIPISNSNAFSVFTEADGINCCVQCMYQDQSGNMWWGAGAGLYRFDGKRFYQVKQKGPWSR